MVLYDGLAFFWSLFYGFWGGFFWFFFIWGEGQEDWFLEWVYKIEIGVKRSIRWIEEEEKKRRRRRRRREEEERIREYIECQTGRTILVEWVLHTYACRTTNVVSKRIFNYISC